MSIKDKTKTGWVSHGSTTHSMEKRLDCLDCIDTELEFLQDVKKAGGVTNLIKQLKKEVKNNE